MHSLVGATAIQTPWCLESAIEGESHRYVPPWFVQLPPRSSMRQYGLASRTNAVRRITGECTEITIPCQLTDYRDY
jgi:hypothetical protein